MKEGHFRGFLLLSLLLNALLGLIWVLVGPVKPKAEGQARDANLSPSAYYINPLKMALPLHRPLASEHTVKRARLTNVVMPFHARQEPAVLRNLEMWKVFPPCQADPEARLQEEEPFFAKDEHPGGRLGRNVTFTFFVSSDVDPELELRLLAAFAALPAEIRACYDTVNVRFSRLSSTDDKYLTGSRKMFEFMLNGWLGMQEPQYVLYMEPDCLPIRPNWLMILDATTRWPNAPFWIKGSMFRGQAKAITNLIIYNLVHINGNALYNLGDPAFRHFYFDQVRPFIRRYYNEGAYDTDIYKFLLDLGNYNQVRRMAHLFHFTDAIQNMWHSNYSISELKAMSEMVVLVHGGTPSP